jgi:hypothetical protein
LASEARVEEPSGESCTLARLAVRRFQIDAYRLLDVTQPKQAIESRASRAALAAERQ